MERVLEASSHAESVGFVPRISGCTFGTSFHLFGQALISGMNKKGSSPVRGYCLRHADAAGPPFRDAGAQAARESHRHPYL